jgi:hypothetical protein
MPIADVKEYCKTLNVPLTSIRCTPYYDEKKQRVSKGDAIGNTGWKEKGRYEYNKTITTPNEDTPATMWMMSLKKAGMYVIDIDIKGDKKAKDVLNEDIYNGLYNSCNYVIETGSGGLHFYFRLQNDFTGRIKNYTNIDSDKGMFKDGEDGSVDVIMDAIITEGSSYSFDGRTYKYISIKPGDGIKSASTWAGFSDFYKRFLHSENKQISSSTVEFDYNELVEHLDNIPNNTLDWESWYRMGQTIFNIVGGKGYELFVSWSSKNSFHSELKTQQLWKGLSQRTDGNKRGVGSLLFLSKESNEKQYIAIRKKYAPLSYEVLKDLLEQNHFFIQEPRPMYIRVSGTSLIQYIPTSFRELLMNWNYILEEDGKQKEVPFYNTWVKDINKKTYKRIGYYPNISECPEDEFNGFFPCRASTLPINKEEVDISPILNHISIMTNHHEALTQFIIKGFAQMIQEPGVLKGICSLFYAKEGAGKDILINLFGLKVLGEHQYLFVGSLDNLFKNFNSEMNGKILIHADELVKLDRKNIENLKRIITAGRCRVEKKGVDATTERWFGRIYGTTNNNDAFPATSLSDRRFLASHSSDEKRKDIPYFERLVAFMNDDKNIRAFYDYLMKIDISDYTHTNRPETEFYKEMKSASMDKILLWILHDEDCFSDDEMKATEWLVKYNNWADTNNERKHNITSFGLAMNKLIETKDIGIEKKTPQNKRYYVINRNAVLEYLKKEELI